MNIILLSGGSGKRLWPLSNDVRSKQFIKFFKDEKNEAESMLQKIYRQIKSVDKDATITLATSKKQVSAIKNQLGDDVGISIEPERRDTFPAIALACMYLLDVKKVKRDEVVIVCPVDQYVNKDYFESINDLASLAQEGKYNLTLMGIEPTYPSDKYGYIIPSDKNKVSKVETFKEKPDIETSKKYISQGALWNGGVFAFKLGYVVDKAHEYLDFVDYYDLYSKYDTAKKISFDYAVVEKEESIQVMRFSGIWKDIGTWKELTESMTDNVNGKGIISDSSNNVHIINETSLPILAIGLNDVVISASPDGILVANKDEANKLKSYVDNFNDQVMICEKSWGNYQVINVEDSSLTIKVTLKKGHRMNYHSHDKRDEVWVVIKGEGKTIVDDMEQNVRVGDVITMQSGCKHTIIALSDLHLIEVQLGTEISVSDKHKYDFD